MIYFMAKEGTDEVKIGRSISPADRKRKVSWEWKCDVRVIRTIDCAPWVERWLHWRFSDVWLNNEWFTFHPDMMTIEPPAEKPDPFPRLCHTEEYKKIMPKTADHVVLFRADDELRAAIVAAAKAEQRSVSQWLNLMIQEALKAEEALELE